MALVLKNVSLTLGESSARVEILKNISISIAEGETVSLLGASGSGKSSLLMLMSGLEKAQTGTIHYHNLLLSQMNEEELADFRAKNVGIVFQSFHLIPTLNALDNVKLALELAGFENCELLAKEELARVDLQHRLHHFPAQLSGGEQQRVALARAFAARPKLIFADEPTGNLDEKTGVKIIDLMFERQKEQSSTLILVTHDEALGKRCARTLRLKNGEIESDTNL